jgi:hypothetical protein
MYVRNRLCALNTDVGLSSDPIFNSRSHEDSACWPELADPQERNRRFALHAEEHFEGRVLRSASTRTMTRLGQAARDVLLVGGQVHYRAIEPTWQVSDDRITLDVTEPAFDPHDCFAPVSAWGDRFGFARLDAAKAWHAERYGGAFTIEGRVLSQTAEIVAEPAMSRPLQRDLGLLLKMIDNNRDMLGAEAVAAWGRLRRAARSIRAYDLGELNRDPAPLLQDLALIVADLKDRFLPQAAEERASNVGSEASVLLRRWEFERAFVPSLDADDEAAFAEMATPAF